MLDYLVPSKARRRLVLLLWAAPRNGELRRGSATELAEAAKVSFSSAHKELAAMKQRGLVCCTKDGASDVYFANENHPHFALMRDLVAMEHSSTPVAETPDDAALTASLRRLGAPLAPGARTDSASAGNLASLVTPSVALARKRPEVAKALPVLFAQRSGEFSQRLLRDLRMTADDKRALGFLLDVAGLVANNQRLATLAESLHDRRVRKLHPFFVSSKPRRTTPAPFPLAARWGFSMTMNEDTFRGIYSKATAS